MTPPRLAERWLRKIIPSDHAREGIVGDLRQEHAHVARRFTIAVAHAWYWFQAGMTALSYIAERARERRKPKHRERGSSVRAFWNDLKLAARVAKRAPVFSAVAIVTIALGVGATTAIFSVVDGVVLKPLPYRDAPQLVRISHTAPGSNIDRMGAPDGTFFHYRENASTLAEYALYIESSATTDGDSGATEEGVIQATPSLFSVLGVKPLLGRLFTEEEGQSGAAVVVILTHKFWMSRFGGDSTVIGKPLSERSPVPIVGVLPEWFDFIRPEAFVTFGNSFDDPAIIVNLRLQRSTARFGNFMYQAIGRLAPGATAQDANRELTTLMHQMPELYPKNGLTTRMVQEGRHAPIVEPFKNVLVGDIADVLWIIMGAVGLVLLIAMVNVLNLFAVRAESRRREIAVRRALGATGARLSQSFLAESFLLTTAGTVLGVMLAASGTGMLLRIAPSNIPRLDQVVLDWRALAFAGSIALVSALVLGLVPVARYARLSLAAVAGDGSRATTSGRERNRARHAMVVAQIGFAMMLLVGSGLLMRTFWNLRHVEPGFGAADVLTVRVTLGNNFDGPQGRTDYLLELTQTLEQLPGVVEATYTGDLPLDGNFYHADFATPEAIPEEDAQAPRAARSFIGPGYLKAVGATLFRGREMTRNDYATDPDVAVVNRTFAEERWPGQDPLEQRLVQWPAESGAWYRVVGVVGDIREASLAREPEPMVYLPTVFIPGTTHGMFVRNFAIVLRTSGDPLSVLPMVREEIAKTNMLVPITTVQSLEHLKAASMQQLSFAMLLLVTAGSAALLLGVIGIYGVVAYVVSQRTREIGVRIALGAQTGDVQRMVLRQGGIIGLIGVAFGLAGAAGLSRVLESLLFGVAGTDLVTYAGTSVLLLVLVLGASFLPARRAAAVDPMNVLRAE